MDSGEIPGWFWVLAGLLVIGLIFLIIRSGVLGILLTLLGALIIIGVIYVVVRALNR
jgi:FtsH-binding integral membrane protein